MTFDDTEKPYDDIHLVNDPDPKYGFRRWKRYMKYVENAAYFIEYARKHGKPEDEIAAEVSLALEGVPVPMGDLKRIEELRKEKLAIMGKIVRIATPHYFNHFGKDRT
jgi:hypothetical protein